MHIDFLSFSRFLLFSSATLITLFKYNVTLLFLGGRQIEYGTPARKSARNLKTEARVLISEALVIYW